MAFYIAQGGSNLYQITTAGTPSVLTLPSGVSIDSTRRMRAASLGNLTVIVNSPNLNLSADRFGTVRVLCPAPPTGVPILTVASGGSLTGTYSAKCTFFIKDDFGNILAESGFSPLSANVSPASQTIAVTNVPTSAQTVSGRRLYRNTSNGAVYYKWVEVDGNIVTAVTDALADASLSLLEAPTDLGTPPKLSQIVEWRNRLWGVEDGNNIDALRYSGNGRIYAWAPTQSIPIPPPQRDQYGITGLIRRRDELGIGKRTAIHKITGTGPSNFTRYTVVEGIGVLATDSITVIRDVGYFLGLPFGIYTWDSSGVKSISDDKVMNWFQTDTYFNRSRFQYAVGCYDPVLNGYVCFLSAAGSTDLDRWIFYSIDTQTWWGPHRTTAFTTNGGAEIRDANDVPIMAWFGTDGRLYKAQSTYTDGASTAISTDVTTGFMSADSPDIFKQWLQPSIVTGIEAGGTLTITPKVGGLDAIAGSAISHDLTLGRERLRRLGPGRFLQLQLTQATNTRGFRLYGIEIPFFELGRR
jgi:hypothetical protein